MARGKNNWYGDGHIDLELVDSCLFVGIYQLHSDGTFERAD